MLFNVVFADENGTVAQFEDNLISKAEQARRTGRDLIWIKLAKIYLRQKERLKLFPYPEEFKENTPEDENPPVVKHVERNTSLENLYRWGIQFGRTGNHRILYTIHNYHIVVLLHYFDKQYNGDIRKSDIEPAEIAYFNFCDLPYKERIVKHEGRFRETFSPSDRPRRS